MSIFRQITAVLWSNIIKVRVSNSIVLSKLFIRKIPARHGDDRKGQKKWTPSKLIILRWTDGSTLFLVSLHDQRRSIMIKWPIWWFRSLGWSYSVKWEDIDPLRSCPLFTLFLTIYEHRFWIRFQKFIAKSTIVADCLRSLRQGDDKAKFSEFNLNLDAVR
jgi:hypothetical protein